MAELRKATMTTTHDHHDHCEHQALKYCTRCDLVYCTACAREWGRTWAWSTAPATWPWGSDATTATPNITWNTPTTTWHFSQQASAGHAHEGAH
jgi:hypothetical protein